MAVQSHGRLVLVGTNGDRGDDDGRIVIVVGSSRVGDPALGDRFAVMDRLLP